MGSSLFAGISGLNASSKQMDVIGNNIANVNTIGFKSSKIHFSDILSQSMTGGSSTFMQVGRGVSISNVNTQFSPGSFETTSNATDLSIDGDGFFIVKDADGGSYYTRAGAFHVDSEGYLVDNNDYRLQGYNFFGNNTNTITDISLRNVQSAPAVTSVFSIGSNLNAQAEAGEIFNASQTVYDSLGTAHTVKVQFQKTEGNGYWGIRVFLDDNEATTQSCYGLKFDGEGNLDQVYSATAASAIGAGNTGTGTVSVTTVNNQGQLYTDGTATLTSNAGGTVWSITSTEFPDAAVTRVDATTLAIDLDGAGGTDMTLTLDGGTWDLDDTIAITIDATEAAPADVAVTFPDIGNGATIGSANEVLWDLVGSTAEIVTGYSSPSVVKSLTHDGYSSGVLKSLSVLADGTINGFFTNGQTTDIGQVVLADFSNPWGLKRMGSNLFGETLTSGPAVQNIPGSAGMGEITSNSLEMSNTDIATEFINMITAQRAYQASAKIITTTDSMMAELMNIKR